jgi:hypothetical protein
VVVVVVLNEGRLDAQRAISLIVVCFWLTACSVERDRIATLSSRCSPESQMPSMPVATVSPTGGPNRSDVGNDSLAAILRSHASRGGAVSPTAKVWISDGQRSCSVPFRCDREERSISFLVGELPIQALAPRGVELQLT